MKFYAHVNQNKMLFHVITVTLISNIHMSPER
jgi:hypothetical protein